MTVPLFAARRGAGHALPYCSRLIIRDDVGIVPYKGCVKWCFVGADAHIRPFLRRAEVGTISII